MSRFKSVEIPLFLAFFSFMVTDPVYTNQVIYRTCYSILGYNKSDCAKLGIQTNDETEKLEKIVQPHAATISMVQNIITNLTVIVLCFFIGPWSDKFGRTPVINITMLGFVFTNVSLAVFSLYDELSPWYLLVCWLPVMVTGGSTSFMTAILAYITDVSSETDRGLRMGIFEAALAAGMLVGTSSSSYIFAATNYVFVFALAGFCCFLAFVFTVIFIPESLAVRESEGKFRNFLQFSNISTMVRVSLEKRENHGRTMVFLCFIAMSVNILAMFGDASVFFLFLREKFEWTLKQYTMYSSATSLAWIFGTAFGVYVLHKVLKVPESLLILVGFISLMNGALVYGLATASWHIYLAGLFRTLGGVLSPMLRSLISKTVDVDEIGKIFSLLMIVQSLFGLFSSPLYTEIYNHTLDKNPAFYSFVTAGLYAFTIVISLVIIFLQLRNGGKIGIYGPINEDVDGATRVSD